MEQSFNRFLEAGEAWLQANFSLKRKILKEFLDYGY